MTDSLDENGLPLWPAAERNKQIIWEKLESILPKKGGVLLEIAAATGQHAVHFAPHLAHYEYHLSDCDEQHLETLSARQKLLDLPHLKAPVHLDVTQVEWPLLRADVIYNANMIHIAPWQVSLGLFRGASRLLSRGGLLITYGPYRIGGQHTSESNERFDASLKSRDPSFGVRDLDELTILAKKDGFSRREPQAMPANNFLVVWDRE